MAQWSVTLLSIGKPRAVDNMDSMFWVWHFKGSVCVCWALVGRDATKNIFNVTIYKTLKWTELTTLKLPLSTEALIWLNIIVWVGGSLLRFNYYHEFGLWIGRHLWAIHISWSGLRTAVWRALSCFAENCSVTASRHFRAASENKSNYFLICFAQTKITLFIFGNKWVIRKNESFLLVEQCSSVPKSRGNGGVSC